MRKVNHAHQNSEGGQEIGLAWDGPPEAVMPIRARNLLLPFLYLTLDSVCTLVLQFSTRPFLVLRMVLSSYHKTCLRQAALNLFMSLLEKDPNDFAAAFPLAPPRCRHVSVIFSH